MLSVAAFISRNSFGSFGQYILLLIKITAWDLTDVRLWTDSNCQPGLLIKSWHLEKNKLIHWMKSFVLYEGLRCITLWLDMTAILYHEDPIIMCWDKRIFITPNSAIRYLFLVLSSRIDGRASTVYSDKIIIIIRPQNSECQHIVNYDCSEAGHTLTLIISFYCSLIHLEDN